MSKARLPDSLLKKHYKVLIICEGQEDYEYISRLIEIGAFSSELVIEAMDAGGASKIFSCFKNVLLVSPYYDLVVIYCDTEMYPYEEYNRQTSKVNSLYNGVNISKDIFYFVNPVTMQLMLLHKGEALLTSSHKSDYYDIVYSLFGVSSYRARLSQVNEITSQINLDNYLLMKKRAVKLASTDYRKENSTNALYLFNKLEKNDTKWIKDKSNLIKSILIY
ncbi:MAG: hypothetical protein LUB56_03155 [Coprobacillus sp.]|nr:hypothetical protein [Coprobacillus sp.]